MKINKALQYETYVIIGILMVITTLAKLVFNVPIDSDWFWFIAGVALVIEGYIDLKKQKQFSNKYKIISKNEFQDIWGQLEEYRQKCK